MSKYNLAEPLGKNLVLVSGAVLFREQHGKTQWFLVKQATDNTWELPKVIVRKGESSVRAILRILGEKGGMTTRVLEEAGRTSGMVTTDNKTLAQMHLYYLAALKSGSKDAVGFGEYVWLEYPAAAKKLASKKEKAVLKEGREIYKKWKKSRQSKKA